MSGQRAPASKYVMITVPDASKIVDSHGKEHVVYNVQIRARGVNRIIAKKYSEFRQFDTVWRTKYPTVKIQRPPKVWINNRSDRVVAERKVLLQTYLNGLLEIRSILPYMSKFLGVPVDVLQRGQTTKPRPSLPITPSSKDSTGASRRSRDRSPAASNASSSDTSVDAPVRRVVGSAPSPAARSFNPLNEQGPSAPPPRLPVPPPFTLDQRLDAVERSNLRPLSAPASRPPEPAETAPSRIQPPTGDAPRRVRGRSPSPVPQAQRESIDASDFNAALLGALKAMTIASMDGPDANGTVFDGDDVPLLQGTWTLRGPSPPPNRRKSTSSPALFMMDSAARDAQGARPVDPRLPASASSSRLAAFAAPFGLTPSSSSGDLMDPASSQSLPSIKMKRFLRCVLPYEAKDATQLSLVEGEIIEALDTSFDRGWGYGRNRKGRQGYFPSDFVEPM